MADMAPPAGGASNSNRGATCLTRKQQAGSQDTYSSQGAPVAWSKKGRDEAGSAAGSVFFYKRSQ